MMAAEHEVHDALTEGVSILDGVMPLEVIKGEDGRAKALKVCDCTMDGMKPIPTEGTERVLEADLIVSAIGQGGDLTGLEDFDNGRGLMNADKFYQVPDKPGHFVAGDIIRPHLLTTAIGQASIAADSINEYVMQAPHARRPKVDVHHFNLLKRPIWHPGNSTSRSAATCAVPPMAIGPSTTTRTAPGLRSFRTMRCSLAISRSRPATSVGKTCRPQKKCSVTSTNASSACRRTRRLTRPNDA
jgi:hypothetical protein